MCDPSITLEQLHNNELFIQLRPNDKFINGETLYLAINDKNPIFCEQVVRNDKHTIEFTNNSGTQSNQMMGTKNYLKRSINNGINIYRKNVLGNRRQILSVLEGTEPNDRSHIERYLRSPDVGKEVGSYIPLPSGGKKYRKKRTKRTTKTNRKKSNRKKRTRRR
jgi:hypothetical protein